MKTRRLGRLLVACQVGLSVLLLVAAGLFVQTLRNLSSLDMGFSVDQLLQVSIDTRFAGYGGQRLADSDAARREGEVAKVFRLLLERVGSVAGVRSVTGTRNWLMRGENSRMAIDTPGLDRRGDETWSAATVGPAFFETMGIPVVQGRTLTEGDIGPRGGRYVVNEAFARHFFGNDDPTVRAAAIVGVVRDVKLFGARSELLPLMYEPIPPGPDRMNALQVRTDGDPEAVIPAVREAVQSVNPRLFVGIATMREEVERGIAKERMVAAISAFFSVLGLLLASVGLFGVTSHAVAQRTKELAIRRALGAGGWSVIRESLRETMVVFGAGLALGTLAAIVAVRLTASVVADLLFGLDATDAVNVISAVGVMVGVALAACLLPAHRATRIEPLVIIRNE